MIVSVKQIAVGQLWYSREGDGGWRLARSGEPAQRSCDHCNAKQER